VDGIPLAYWLAAFALTAVVVALAVSIDKNGK
jgi:hypothetical protein